MAVCVAPFLFLGIPRGAPFLSDGGGDFEEVSGKFVVTHRFEFAEGCLTEIEVCDEGGVGAGAFLEFDEVFQLTLDGEQDSGGEVAGAEAVAFVEGAVEEREVGAHLGILWRKRGGGNDEWNG